MSCRINSEDNNPNNEDNSTPLSTNSEDKKRKSRGATRLPDVIKNRSSGVRPVIEYNDKGQPKGKNKPKFSSYLGVLARTMIPLSHKDWHEVSDELKEKLWSSVTVAFDVDPRSRKHVLSSISSCLRGFRRTLTTHIYENKSDPTILSKPPEVYNFLEQKEWDSYVKGRLTREFEALRELQQSRRKCNLYDHKLSRKGYAGLEEEIIKNSEEPIGSVDRSLMWKKARQNKDGEFDNVTTEQKAMEIDDISKKVKDGTLQVQGRNDILTMALGGTERSGIVRAVGGMVTPTMYFNIPRRGIHSRCEEKHQVLENAVSHLRVQLDAVARHTPHTPQSDNIGSNTYRSDNIACSKVNTFAIHNWDKAKDDMAHPNPTPSIKKGNQCKLAIGSINNIVAEGTIYEKMGPNELLHTVPLGEGNSRVSIDIVKVQEVLLPIPIPGQAATVGEAIGFHVAWPTNLILIPPETKNVCL